MPPSPTNDTWPQSGGSIPNIRHLRRRGYHIHSDEESRVDDDEYNHKRPVFSDGEDNKFLHDFALHNDNDRIYIRTQSSLLASGPREWIQTIWPSILPQHTERIQVLQDMALSQRVLASFTMYHELKNAQLDSQYEKVFTRLQTEWTYVGGLARCSLLAFLIMY